MPKMPNSLEHLDIHDVTFPHNPNPPDRNIVFLLSRVLADRLPTGSLDQKLGPGSGVSHKPSSLLSQGDRDGVDGAI